MIVTQSACDGLELRQLRYLLALATAGSFRRAARVLSISPGVLSRQIAVAERRIGARLFERLPRAAVPTALGIEIAEMARCVLGRHVVANREVTEGESVLEVGYLDYGPGQEILTAALAEFQAQYPHVTVRLAPRSLIAAQAFAVGEGIIRVGFSFGPPLPAPGVISEVLLRETVGSAMLPAHHRLAGCAVVSLSELRSTPIHTVRVETAPEIVSATFDGLARGGWRGRMTDGSAFPSEMMARIAGGAGWAPSPSSLQDWTPRGTAVIPLADGPLVDFEVRIVWRVADDLAAAFIRIAIDIRDVIEAAGHSQSALPDADAVSGRSYHALMGPRYAERARIARDLHDTVLQGVVGTQLQLQALHQHLSPALAREREWVRQSVERLERVGREAREAVRRLRPTHHGPRDLAFALAAAAEELGEVWRVEFEMRVEGIPRPLCADVEAAAYRISVEALTNAFRHASAELVSVVVAYWDDEFRISVADDGVGIPARILAAGSRPDHFGLIGMRERAAEAGATLTIQSDANSGTHVNLVVPGDAAFVSAD